MSSGPPAVAATDPVDRALDRAHGVLPDQGPIGVFIHHNTLHAFQHLPFHEGVQAGARALGARPYLSMAEFRALNRSGRVADVDIRAEVEATLGPRGNEAVAGPLTRSTLWHTLLVTDCDSGDAAGLAYLLRAGIAPQSADLDRWHACLSRVSRGAAVPPTDERQFRRHRDVLVALGGDDTDVAVHGEMIRLAAGFLDHGQAHTQLPGRERGFLRAVVELYAAGAATPHACRGAEADMRGVHTGAIGADTVIRTTLDALGVTGDDIEPFLFATALALPGWSGMFSRLEHHPHEHVGDTPPTLAEFLAVRLLLERRAVERVCAALGTSPLWTALQRTAPPLPARPVMLDADLLWQIARRAGLSPAAITALDEAALNGLLRECAAFPDLLRRQTFMQAYERTYRRSILDALAARRTLAAGTVTTRPRAQFVFCIDEREESTRRAIEEQHPGYLTYGVAGFFGVAIDYQGLYDREPAAHCPVVVTPGHQVHEHPVYTDLGWHSARQRLRDRWHGWERRAAASSRTLSGGVGMSFLLGPLSAVKTMAHVLAPRSFVALVNRLVVTVAPRPSTRLSSMRVGEATDRPSGAKPVGFSLQESVDRVTSVLRNIGMTQYFAPVVVFLGHGSTSLNNPHESAHDCGACGGRRGGANARLFADMANRPEVRDGVRQRGVAIPADTWFVGALHDTADDSVLYYDLDALPVTHAAAFDEAYQVLEQARRDDARERSRRFDDAPLGQSAAAALHHVESRSTLLAQPRPEYGHCTNSICIVGRREMTRGLHLDRRAFLVSYDQTIDPDNAILERIVAAVGPVGAGISLEYYFSTVDNETFGCGTKLPHNVTGFIGVMNGHQSDLRTGLPLQMVELHEAMRLLLIVEATPAALLDVASRLPEVLELVGNAWVQLVAMDPDTGAMAVFEGGAFVPYQPAPVQLPEVAHSPAWHMRSRAHLTPALVRSALPAAPALSAAHEPVRAGAVHG